MILTRLSAALCLLLKFADDTKLVARVGSEEDRERLRQDLFKWSEDWQILFNLDKCGVMQLGFANEGMEVRLGDKVLGVQKSERDLGDIMQSDLKVDKQCSKAANEANTSQGWAWLTLSLPAYHCRQWKCWRIYASPVAKGLTGILNAKRRK